MRTIKKIVGFAATMTAFAVLAAMGISAYSSYAQTPGQAMPTPVIRTTFTDRPASSTASNAGQLLDALPVRHNTKTPRYDRDRWATRWGDHDEDCHNTRAEVLDEQSRTTVSYSTSNPCRVASGSWITPWTQSRVYSAAQLQIDHHVPVADAHRSGGHLWSAKQRTSFYNDTDNLNALPSEVNQDKSAHKPDRWRPELESTWCDYARQWVQIKGRYQLSVTSSEKRALSQMLRTCR